MRTPKSPQGGACERFRAAIEPDRGVAIQKAIANCSPGDVVLVAGKGHETWQEVGDQRIPFSDEATILDALEDAA